MQWVYRIGTVFIGVLLLALVGGLLWAASQLAVFQSTVTQTPLEPSILENEEGVKITSVEEWEDEKQKALQYLRTTMYGEVPLTEIDWQVEKRILNKETYGSRATLELWTLTSPDETQVFNVVALIPKTESPLSLVVASNFCPNHTRFIQYDIPAPNHYPSMCGQDSVMSPVMHGIFGELIDTFPFEQFVEKNIALAIVYLGEGVADSPQHAHKDLEKVSALTGENVTGALAAWAWTFIEVTRVFEIDERVDERRTALYGHSRDGKAALIAAAHSDRIDLVLAHQSGKGGASPWQTNVGESIEAITSQYDYWFTPSFSEFTGREKNLLYDQHFLVGTIAPRPVLVSAARLDKWGDPVGAFRAVRDASAIYALYGKQGTESTTLDAFQPENELTYIIRPWFHGVQPSDWNSFFSFLEAHF